MGVLHRFSHKPWRSCGVLGLVVLLSGCDQLGIDTPAKIEEKAAAEAKAVGNACRHAMRAIEDCYTMNPKMQKAAIAAGWREMDEYMRENKLDGVAPVLVKAAPGKKSPAAVDDEEHDAPSEAASKSDSQASSPEANKKDVIQPDAPAEVRTSKDKHTRSVEEGGKPSLHAEAQAPTLR